MTSYIEAQNEMYDRVNVALTSGASAILTYVPQVVFEGISPRGKLDKSRLYLRMYMRNADEDAITWSGHTPNTEEYRTLGALMIDIYVPTGKNSYARKSKLIGQLIRNSLRGQRPGDQVILSNQTFSELDVVDDEPRGSVIAQYRYYEN